MAEDNFIGRFTRIQFINGLAHVDRGFLEPARDPEGYYEIETAKIVCNYKLLLKKVLETEYFGVEICDYFEKMSYEISIVQFYDEKTNVYVTDLKFAGIIKESNSIDEMLNYFEEKRIETTGYNV